MNGGTVVVTGSAGGIGVEITRALCAAGWNVVGIDRVPGPETTGVRNLVFDLARLADDPGAGGAGLRSSILRESALLGAPRIAALVNNAALQVVGRAETLDATALARSLAVNVVAPYALSQLLYPDLVANGGAIVNIGSIHARLTKPGFSAYATSKAALAGMTRALAVEWGARIRVMGIEPAAIATPMLEAGFADDAAARARLAASHPSAGIGEPGLVARWVVHLLAESSGFCNGTVVNLDGGVSHRLNDPA